MIKLIFGLIFLLNLTTSHANSQPIVWYTHGAGEHVKINVDLFLSTTCPHCQKADIFFREVEKKQPWLVVHRHMINQDKSALQTFYERLQQQHSNNFSVPAIFFCDSLWAGFGEASTSGKVLLHALSYCRQKISEQGDLSPTVTSVLQKWGTASQFQVGTAIPRPAFNIVALMGLTDAMNPCSLFCFIAFLAFLWLYPTQKWLQFSVGMIFILSLGFIHYVQQAHSIFYYQMTPKLKIAEVLVGLSLILVVFSTYRKEMSRTRLQPSPLIFVVIIFTVFAVQIYQQTCVLNVALILEQWLTEQSFSPAKRVFYQMVSQVFYLLPLAGLLLFYLIFGRHQRMKRYEPILTIAACLVLTSIGVILVVYSPLLGHLMVSIVVLLASLLVGWLIAKRGVHG